MAETIDTKPMTDLQKQHLKAIADHHFINEYGDLGGSEKIAKEAGKITFEFAEEFLKWAMENNVRKSDLESERFIYSGEYLTPKEILTEYQKRLDDE